jgi:hypothetical protein
LPPHQQPRHSHQALSPSSPTQPSNQCVNLCSHAIAALPCRAPPMAQPSRDDCMHDKHANKHLSDFVYLQIVARLGKGCAMIEDPKGSFVGTRTDRGRAPVSRRVCQGLWWYLRLKKGVAICHFPLPLPLPRPQHHWNRVVCLPEMVFFREGMGTSLLSQFSPPQRRNTATPPTPTPTNTHPAAGGGNLTIVLRVVRRDE